MKEEDENLEALSADCEEEPKADTKLLEKYGILDAQPQQNTFEFSNGITISSKFDSGNLKNCV